MPHQGLVCHHGSSEDRGTTLLSCARGNSCKRAASTISASRAQNSRAPYESVIARPRRLSSAASSASVANRRIAICNGLSRLRINEQCGVTDLVTITAQVRRNHGQPAAMASATGDVCRSEESGMTNPSAPGRGRACSIPQRIQKADAPAHAETPAFLTQPSVGLRS